MSEEQAPYQSEVVITANVAGVWILQPSPYDVSSGALIGPGRVSRAEEISLVSGVTQEEAVGREMVLVAKEDAERTTRERAQFIELLKRWLDGDHTNILYSDTETVLRWAGVDLTEVEAHA